MTKITHNFYQAENKKTGGTLFGLFALLLMVTQVSGQTFTGMYKVDGGMDAQTIGATLASGSDNSKFRNYDLGTAAFIFDASKARSGSKYLHMNGPTNGPTNAVPASFSSIISNRFGAKPPVNTIHTVQFYYRTADGSPVNSASILGTIYPNGYSNSTANPIFAQTAISTTTVGIWTKAVATFSAAQIGGTTNNTSAVAGIKFAVGSNITNLLIDDFAVYTGVEDNAAPNSPASFTFGGASSSTQNVLNWTQPVVIGSEAASGVDGGGYMVVRYLGNPSNDSDPLVNGIYTYQKLKATVPATNEDLTAGVIDKGTGPVDGVVVYYGTALTYTDIVPVTTPAIPADSYYYKIYAVDKAFNYSAERTATRGVVSPIATLVADVTNNNVDNDIDITFTDDTTWRAAVTGVSVNGTSLSASDYVLTAGNLQLKPSVGNTLLRTSGLKSVSIIATGYVATTTFQVINVGAVTPANCVVTLVAAPLALGVVKTMNCTAKDQYSNLVSGYQFKYDATITNANVNTAESYTIDGVAQTSTANDVNLVALTNASGLASFTIALPAVVDAGDGVSVQVQLNDGTTNVGSAASYTQTTTTWSGSAWLNGNPSATVEAIVDGTYSGAGFDAKKLTVNSAKSLTIATGTLTVQNEVINNGTFVINNNANLVQVNSASVNTGNVVINRNSSLLKRLDYTLWSSPVAGQNLAAFSPLTSQLPNRFYTYDTAANVYAETSYAASFVSGAGYLIRMPNTADPVTPTAYPGVFTGVPNNGNIPFTLVDGGVGFRYNLVGNPYPSPITISTFLADNANITGTLYFWRKTNGVGTAYCTVTGGVFASNGDAQSFDPAGVIQTGQGFIVEANGLGTALTFKNTHRAANTAGQFFKTKQVAVADRVWLNATNTAGDFSQTAVNYTADATSGVDAFDGKYINDSAFALTSNVNNEEYVIQGRPSFDDSDVVPLNFKTAAAGDYTIAIDHTEGVFAAGQDVYLVDSTTGTETNLKSGSYTFTASAGASNARFALKYQKTLGVNDVVFNENNVAVYNNKGVVYVNSGAVVIANIKVYDIQGKLLAELKEVKSNSAAINLKASNQVLVVKVTAEDGAVVTKKVVN